LREPTFTRGQIVVTEATENGFMVRVLAPPREGWTQVGVHWRFPTRLEALQCSSILAVDLEAAVLNDHQTAIAPVVGRR
jgi:hypothetical protein